MDFTEPQERRDIRNAVAEITARFNDDYWLTCDRDEVFPHEFYQAMADAGWLGVLAPLESGGGSLGIADVCTIMEQVAYSGAAMAGCTALHPTIFAMNIIATFGQEQLKRAVLPTMADGSSHVSFAITEPNSGSDTTRITTFAHRDQAGDFVVSGQKVWISKSAMADAMLILVRTTPREDLKKPSDGLTMLYADIDRDRVLTRKIDKMGRAAVDSCEMFIDELRVPADRVIGEVDRGFYALLQGLNAERIVIAAEALGLGRRALETAVRYAKEREVFGRPIGQNQGIQFPLAESLMELDAASLVMQHAAWKYDQGLECGKEANSAKYLCGAAGFNAADRAVQTHGGFGYAKEYHVERYFRESRVMRIAPISEAMILNYISHRVLGMPKSY